MLSIAILRPHRSRLVSYSELLARLTTISAAGLHLHDAKSDRLTVGGAVQLLHRTVAQKLQPEAGLEHGRTGCDDDL